MTKHALVTGSSSGIGRCIAEHLLSLNWKVHGFDIASATIFSSHFEHQTVDLTDAQALNHAACSLPTLDALVHAAGVLRTAKLGTLNAADGELMWRIHTQAAAVLADVLVPKMTQQRTGRVVLIGSRVASGMAARSQYAATKAGLIALAKSWAAEVAPLGVTVNVISPAATQTAMLSDSARSTSSPKLPPIGRMIEPQEIADLVGFLLSPNAAAITGQDLVICGGSSLTT